MRLLLSTTARAQCVAPTVSQAKEDPIIRNISSTSEAVEHEFKSFAIAREAGIQIEAMSGSWNLTKSRSNSQNTPLIIVPSSNMLYHDHSGLSSVSKGFTYVGVCPWQHTLSCG